MKTCTVCKKELEETAEFFPTQKGRLLPKCRECTNKYVQAWRQKNRGRLLTKEATFRETKRAAFRAYHTAWRRKNAEHVKTKAREWRNRNRDKALENQHRYEAKPGYKERRKLYYRATIDRRRDHLFRKMYGVSLAEYVEMSRQQGGLCAICCGAPVGNSSNLSVDHDHETDLVRGLLCGKCNFAIGQMDNSPERLRAAADYLEKHKARHLHVV